MRQHLAPGVGRYSLDEMLSRRRPDGTPVDAPDVFDGPALEHGFIDSAELAAADLRTEVRLSDVVSIVMDIAGVRAVRDMLVSPEQPEAPSPLENRWVVPVEPGKQPTLNVARCRLLYYKRNMPIVPAAIAPPPADVPPALEAEDIAIPAGVPRAVREHHSFQHHFPAVYGVGDNPLPTSAGARRLALAAQLEAYLLFFDQVMSNYCAQLAEAERLFSIDPAADATYFSQIVSRSPEYLRIYGVDDAGAGELEEKLNALIETGATRTDRRTRFLNHLIARFAERFHDFALIMRSAFGATDASLIADRRAFLTDYPAISGSRTAAYNYTLTDAQDSWDSLNVSGLEKRLARLLGVGNHSRRNLTDVILGADAQVTGDPVNQFGFTLRDADTAAVLMKESAKLTTADLAQQQLLRALELGQWSSTYLRAVNDSLRWFFTIAAKDGEIVAQSEEFETEAEVDAGIVALRTYLRRRCSREGFYIIENLLLRPEQDGDASLHSCADPGCTDCGAGDPYSFRIHVILPAYAGRFNNMDFRRFVEDVIREETPAHILPKICWIDETSMGGVQKAYREWLEIRSGAVTADRAARIKALVDALTTIKSVYPVQALTDCGAPENQPKFILGQSALGSKKDND